MVCLFFQSIGLHTDVGNSVLVDTFEHESRGLQVGTCTVPKRYPCCRAASRVCNKLNHISTEQATHLRTEQLLQKGNKSVTYFTCIQTLYNKDAELRNFHVR